MSSLLDVFTKELRGGALMLAVLSQLRTPQNSYSLIHRLEQVGINIELSTLFSLLRRLEHQEVITSSWDTPKGKARKYYVLSTYGSNFYEQFKTEWAAMDLGLHELLKGEGKNESD
ncbi:helix-turn-helix transcriptional regulator [Lysinibacillus agricola]|uniref:Helix-turn-helix transcriptional regulator n=1 Tax=Lysinibacillus agricola TaxID=2590012 RepID=A0ABX7ARP2_9BACI|nr:MULTISPECIES: helix-turn-helix transcriptional regulator [Lysinibacillus]KOS61138.1 PadR family transcriptional regulator [Lysinibacillus sp. FJAT-14222]QQP12489.1 helix-turn-helix transcriptional regulator [Lysinibacillus agricola]